MPDELGTPVGPPPGQADANAGAHGRSPDELALDLMKFIAGTTGYGKTTGVGAGFQSGAANKAEDYAKHLLDLYGQCLTSIKGKK